MPTRNRGSRVARAPEADDFRRSGGGRERRFAAAFAILSFLLVASNLSAYVVKLKDGTRVFARSQYVVKGSQAIITLENGTLTQIPLVQVDQPGSEKYNRENYGNAIRIYTPPETGVGVPGGGLRFGAAAPRTGKAVDAVLWGGPSVPRARRLGAPRVVEPSDR
jgi:hypothetical protein